MAILRSDAEAAVQPARPSKRLTAGVQRVLALTVIDQGVSSLSNFALAFLVAHNSGSRALGIFAILTTTYVLAQGLVRSMTSDCLLTRHETDDGVMGKYERSGFLSALILSSALAVLLLAASPFLGASFRVPMIIFALCFPLMAAQDFSRYIGISRHEPAYAIALDTAWIVLYAALTIACEMRHLHSLPWLFGAWTVSGAAVGLFTLRSHLSRGGRALLRFWVDSEREVALRFAGQFMVLTSWSYVIFYLLVFVISINSVGQIKLAQLAFGPLIVLMAGIQSATVSISSKKFRADTTRALRFLLVCGLALTGITAVWTLTLYAIPVHTMAAALGPTWRPAHGLILYVGLAYGLVGIQGMAITGLRSMRAAKENLRLAVAMLPVLLVLCMVGASVWGTRGFVVMYAVSVGSYAVLGWFLVIRISHHYAPSDGPDDGSDDVITVVTTNTTTPNTATVNATNTVNATEVVTTINTNAPD